MPRSNFDSTELPALSPRTQCVLIPRDPNYIYAYWDYTRQDIDRARHERERLGTRWKAADAGEPVHLAGEAAVLDGHTGLDEAHRVELALVSQDYPPGHNGGIARNMQELARAFARLGHRPHVFTAARAAPSLDFEDGVWVHRVAPRHAGPPGMKVGR